MASDVDLVILTPNFAQLAAHPNWFLQLRPGSQLIHPMAWGPPARAPLPDAQRTAGRRRPGASGLAELPLDPSTQRVLTMGTPCFGTHEDSYFVPAKCSTAVARRPTDIRASAVMNRLPFELRTRNGHRNAFPLERRVLHGKACRHTAAGRHDFDRGRPARSRQPRHPDPAEERPSHDVEAIALVIGPKTVIGYSRRNIVTDH